MPIYNVQLKKRIIIANHTLQFNVNKPEGFTFLAGQYAGVNLTLPPHPTQIRRFSFCSTPDEEELTFATRIHLNSDYKKLLLSLPLDTSLKIAGPSGEFVWRKNSESKVFLVCGIGITPVMSILKTHLHETPSLVYLFYSNRYAQDIAWHEEIFNLKKQFSNFKVIFHLTGYKNISEKPFSQEHYRYERIHSNVLSRYLNPPHLLNSEYYLCGQEAFVSDLQQQLISLSCEKIMTESFK